MIQNRFTGMDLDSEDRYLLPGKTRENFNSRLNSSISRNKNAVESIPGNLLSANVLPAGTNKTIGSYEDIYSNTIIFFNWNSGGGHGIYRYFPDDKHFELIYLSSKLNFSEFDKIYDINLVDNLLYWHDANNPPRKINIDKANNTNKASVLTINFADYVPTSTAFNIVFQNGTITQTFALSISDKTRQQAVDLFFTAITAIPFFTTNFSITKDNVRLTMTSRTGKWWAKNTDDNTLIWVVLENSYDQNELDTDMYFDAVKYPPHIPIKTQVLYDSTRATSYIRGYPFQFRYRYIYDDKEKSVWSDISLVGLGVQQAGNDMLNTRNNYILLDYTDGGNLLLPSYRNMIKKVELAFRINNTGEWQSMVTLQEWEMSGMFKFYNDGSYSSIAETEASIPYDYLPLKVGAQEIAKDRIFYADNLEGYDSIIPDLNLTVDFNDSPTTDTWTVKGWVLVYNLNGSFYSEIFEYNPGFPDQGYVFGGLSSDRNVAKNLGQFMQNGIPVYLAGTKYNGLVTFTGSKQVTFNGSNVKAYPFEITGVPQGTYALRFASQKCRFDNNNGAAYNMGADNLLWQTTSTQMYWVVAEDSHTSGKYEYQLQLGAPPVGGGVYDLSQVGINNDGYSIIADLTSTASQSGSLLPATVISGYFVEDPTGVNSAHNMAGSLRVESQKVLLEAINLGVATLWSTVTLASQYTDHNGFFYGTIIFATGTTIPNPYVRVSVTGINSFLLKATATNFFSGDVYDDPGNLTLVTSGTSGSGYPAVYSRGNLADVVCYNIYNNIALIRTNIQGLVTDNTGQNYEGINVVIVKNGRQQRTGVDGQFNIIVYDPATNGTTPGINGLIYIDNASVGIKSFTFSAFTGFNPLGASPTYDSTHPFGLQPTSSSSHFPLIPFVVNLLDILSSSLKRGGGYQYGTVYFDPATRSTTVNTQASNNIYIPTQTQDLNLFYPNQFPAGTYKSGQPIVSWAISNAPPDWATHYAIVRTANQFYNRFIQIEICSATYVIEFDSTQTDPLITTSQGSFEAKWVYFDISTIVYFSQDNTSVYSADTSYLGYTFQQGDRVRILSADSGQNIKTVIDVAIKGQYKNYIIVDNEVSFPAFLQGALIEIYTPKPQVAEKIFYEIGEFYPIVTVNGVKNHGGQTQDQDIANGTPATGTFQHGDTYFRSRSVRTIDTTNNNHPAIYNKFIEDPSISDFFVSNCSDIGRANIIDYDFRQIRRYNGIRFSGKYIFDTNVNGLSSFEALNNDTLDLQYGAIKVLSIEDFVMLAIQEHEATSMYIETTIFTDTTNQNIVSVSEHTINNKKPLLMKMGTQDKGSFCKDRQRRYWWDRSKGTYNRYSNDGVTVLSDLYNMKSFFHDLTVDINTTSPAQIECTATFDRRYEEAIFSVQYINESLNFHTLAFHEPSNNFTTFYTYMPEMLCIHQDNMISFQHGQLWEHTQNPLYNNFYGTQYVQIMTVVFKDNPEQIKFWKSMAVQSNGKWNVFITTPANLENPSGQQSNIDSTDWEYKEGVFTAPFFRDMNTPNFNDPIQALLLGEELKSYAITLQLQQANTIQIILYSINVNAGISYNIYQ